MLPKAIADHLGLTDVGVRLVRNRVTASQDIDARLLAFVAIQEAIQVRARCCQGLSSPVGDFRSAKALRVALRKEQLDCRGRHLPPASPSARLGWPPAPN